MTDFKKVKQVCETNSALSESIIDDFLLYYAADKNDLDGEFDKRLANYKHVSRKLGQSTVNRLRAQYIAHGIFKENGLIAKYLNHSKIKNLPDHERRFLERQGSLPWRFSFSIITDEPAEDFYTMLDVFSGESFLLYSPGVSTSLEDKHVSLWFNLLAYNGSCWQSFGPIGAFRSFDQDDIFFFATELRPSIESDRDLIGDVEKNPVPYMMLLSGGDFPVVVHKDEPLVHVMGEYPLDAFDTTGFEKHFKIQFASEVCRLTPKDLDGPPYFPLVYYDESIQVLTFMATTDHGFAILVEKLKKSGLNVPYEPIIRVHPTMLLTAGDILKKEIVLNEYEDLFEPEVSPKEEEAMDKLNELMQMALPDINAGKEPDVEALAKKVGVDAEVAREALRSIRKRIDELKKRF